MAKFNVTIDCAAACTFEIEAETQDEAFDKAEELIQSDDFFEKYRKDCDFWEPTVFTDI